MPLLKNKNKEDNKDDKGDRKEDRRDFKLSKIQEITAKSYAVAAKRKWLFFLIAALIVGYIVVSSAGVGSGIVEKVKSFFI